MNKKLQKGIVAAVAATMGTGIVAPVYAASAQTTSVDAQYKAAYDATVLAQTTKSQKDMTAARKLVDALYQTLPANLKTLAETLSQLLDGLQHPLLVKTVDAITLAQKSGKQADVNAARALVVDMPEVWRNAYSSAIDTAQNVVITKTVEAVNKAKASGLKAEYDAAKALLDELLTVTNNDGVKSWAETALKAELEAAAKLELVSAKAINSTEVLVTFSTELSSVAVENFDISGDLTIVKAELTSNKKQVKLKLNDSLQENDDYVVEVENVKNVFGNSIKDGSTAKFEYSSSDVVKVELTKTTFMAGANILDEVKVTDEDGRDVTDDVEDIYGYTYEISSTSNNIDEDGDVADITDSEYAYVEIKVMDGDDEVASSGAIKVKLVTSSIDKLVGFHIGDVLADADAYNDLVEDDDVETKMQKQDSGDVYLNVVVKNDGEDYLLTADEIDEIENLTPAIAYVDEDDLKINAVASGTAKIKVTAGDLEATITFTVNANSYIKSADINKTSVTLNSDSDADEFATTSEIKLSFLDQYGDDLDVTLDETSSSATKLVYDVNDGDGTLTITSNKATVATLGAATFDDNEVKFDIIEAGKGTATVKVEFKDDDDDVVFTKSIAVTSKSFGDFADYKVEVDNTTIDLDDEDEDSAEFTVYAVDGSGNKLYKVTSGVELDIQDTDDYEDVEDYIGANGLVIEALNADAIKAVDGTGTLKVDVKVNGVKVSTVSIKYTNTADVATKATISATNVVVDLSSKYGSGTESINLLDLIYGKYDDADEEYDINPILTILDQEGHTIDYNNGSQDGSLENNDTITPVYSVTNKKNVTFDGTTVTLDEDENSGTFTIVISDVENGTHDDLLSAPVSVNVTITR